MAASSIPPATPPANHLGGATASTPRSRRAKISTATRNHLRDQQRRDDETKRTKIHLLLRFWLLVDKADHCIDINSRWKFHLQIQGEKFYRCSTKENLGMAMMYTLVSPAKEWFTYKFCSDAVQPEQTEKPEDEVITPHGQAVIVESFLAWREQFEAELHLKEPST